jgi:hypothetical protein
MIRVARFLNKNKYMCNAISQHPYYYIYLPTIKVNKSFIKKKKKNTHTKKRAVVIVKKRFGLDGYNSINI